jgi:hypothetical protein
MSTDDLLRAVASWSLPARFDRDASPHGPTSARELGVERWASLLQAVRDERLEGPFSAMIATGHMRAARWQAIEAEQAHVEAMALVVRIDDVVRRIAEIFGTARLPMRVLKGAATAHLDHANPALRSYGDADILVPSRHHEHACELLRRYGFVRREPEFTPGFDRRFAKSVTFVSHDGLEVDLHRAIVYGPFSVGIDEPDLWAPGPRFDLGGVSVEALDINRRFVHACIHSAVGSHAPRLTSLRDVVLIGSGAVDPDEIAAIAKRWRIEPVMERAAGLTRTYVGIELDWMRGLLPQSHRDFRLRCSLSEHAPWASATMGLLMTLPSWSDRAALARMLSVSLRNGRGESRGSRVRSLASATWRNTAEGFIRPRRELSLR